MKYDDLDALAERLAADMRQRWQAGDRPVTEDYLATYPALRDHPAVAAELICEEVCLRREAGHADGSAEVLRRFPQWASRLQVLLEVHDTLAVDAPPDYPRAGETLGDFTLVRELGRGMRGRVYLACQASLAGRPVVLKLTPIGDREHVTLARLQHTHIVPLYAAHEEPARRLRVLCLPSFGGASLAAVLDRLAATPVERRTAAGLWQALAGEDRPAPPRFARLSYPELVCWIAACLAEGLAFAHERGLVHLDVKPSNVLLTAEGLPMLLDFHLARAPLPAGAPAPAWLGGTPGYLSPEQRDALECVRLGQPIPTAVDGRSDLYSLGLVLHEMLAGGSGLGAPLRRLNRQVGTGLSDVVARCLAARPEDRYPDAAALADDLRRHLASQPLRGVRNRDLGERWRKWRRRKPLALPVLGLLAVLLGGTAVATAHALGRHRQATAALEEGNAQMQRGAFLAARGAYQRGLSAVEDLPLSGWLRRDLDEGLRRAGRAEAAGDLHRAAEQLRGLYGSDALPAEELKEVEQLGRRLWQERDQLLEALSADREQVRTDLLELALLWSHLRLRLAGSEPARREALAVLEEAEQALGPSVVLAQEIAQHAGRLGLGEKAAEATRRARGMEPRSAWEHYALGCAALRAGSPGRARHHLEQALQREPGWFWAHFYLGRCHLELGRHAEAVPVFGTCTALRPEQPLCYLHRALAHAGLGRREQALRDVERALQLAPGHPAARKLREALR